MLSKQESQRIIGLDILRAAAIMMVVIAHTNSLLFQATTLPWGTGWLLGRCIEITRPFLILGVELFFVLSGFLVGGMLIRQFSESASFTFNDIRNFWIRRWFRTLPNYYFILLLNFLLQFLLIRQHFDWRFIFFLQNLAYPHPGFFGEAWSLSIEEWFYASFPLWLMAVSAVMGKSGKKKIILLAAATYLLCFTGIRVWNAIDPRYQGFDAGIRKITIFRLDALMYGVLMAWVKKFLPEKFLSLKRSLLVTGLLGVAILTLLYFLGNHRNFAFYRDNRPFRFYTDAFLLSLLPLSFALLLPWFDALVSLPYKRFSRIITHISLISYSMYLLHFSLLFKPFFAHIEIGNPWMALTAYFLYWSVLVILSTVLYRFFEKPATDLRERFGGRSR